MKKENGMRWWVALMAVGMVGGLAACSTITPYDLDIARQSEYFGALGPDQAAGIVKTKTSVSGEDADYRSFLVDEQGFSYTKTTEEEKTEWKKDVPVKKKYTHTLTRNVPWNAVTALSPYLQEYEGPLGGSRYRVRLDFKITSVKDGSRMHEKYDLVLNCKTQEDLADVVAALRVLTGK